MPPATRPSSSTPSSSTSGEPVAPPIVAHSGPVFYRIPLRGKVGVTFVASALEKSLADAEKRRPAVVVLEIDSGGGYVSEVDKLIEVIGNHKKNVRIVVWAHKALSAAAITAFCVDEIYMRKGATFGAATAFRVTPTGTADAVEEKMQSAWRARARSAAELGNHSPILAEGMIDRAIGIYQQTSSGKPTLSSSPSPGGAIVKQPGKLLTLTAGESVECGLTKAIADDINELGKLLGFPNWTECEGLAVPLVEWIEKRIVKGDKEWEAAVKRFDGAMMKARTEDPTTYKDYGQDVDSVRKWNNRSTKCSELLRGADFELFQMSKLAKEYEHLASNQSAIEQYRARIAELRTRIEAGRMRIPTPRR